MKFKRIDLLGLCALTIAALFIHGYHPFSEDSETYLPGIEKLLHPQLFPIGNEYFELHAHMTLFPQVIAASVRFLHLPFVWALFFWQIASFFLFLLACWFLLRLLFPSTVARWSGLALISALFTMPIAGTALYVMDPFLNPRNFIAFAAIFTVLRVVERKYYQAAAFLLFSISVHPLMSAFSASFCVLVVTLDRWSDLRRRLFAEEQLNAEVAAQPQPVGYMAAMLMPVGQMFAAPTEPYEKVALTHPYQFLSRWAWYEIIGAVAPIFLFLWFAAIAGARNLKSLQLLSRAAAIYGSIYLIAGLVVSIPHRLEVLSLVQPMRSLWLLYVLMILIGGGLLGDSILRLRVWRWLALFLPLCGGMLYAQRNIYPASSHIEWPQAAPRNPWFQAFLWVKQNTPQQAIFALDPYYMNIPGEDANGFRAIAERSQLADGVKDSGVVELFPQIGNSWIEQVKAQQDLQLFQLEDFARLKQKYGVSWVVLRLQGANPPLACPYQNSVVKVCRLP